MYVRIALKSDFFNKQLCRTPEEEKDRSRLCMGKFRKSIYLILFLFLSVQNLLYFQGEQQRHGTDWGQKCRKISIESAKERQKLTEAKAEQPCQAIKRERQKVNFVKDLSQYSMTYLRQDGKSEYVVFTPEFCQKSEIGKVCDRLRAPPSGNETQPNTVSL